MTAKVASVLTVRRTVLTASAVVLLGAGVAFAQERCDVPNDITLNNFTVRTQANNPTVQLEPIDLNTRLKWTIGILVPNLVKDEVGIHLYKPSAINQSHIEKLDEKHIIPFIVCSRGNSYWAKRAEISLNTNDPNNSSASSGQNNLFFGATVPIPGEQQDRPKLEDSLKGNLRAFQPLAQSNTRVQ